MSELVEVEVARITVGPVSDDQREACEKRGMPVPDELHGVVLKEREGDRELCIYIGPAEAISIGFEREGRSFERPMTHDLFGALVHSLDDIAFDRVLVTRIEDETYYAEMRGTHHGEPLVIDCRPSDGIAVGMRLGLPIYVSSAVPPFSQAA